MSGRRKAGNAEPIDIADAAHDNQRTVSCEENCQILVPKQ
ncbi:hypothetical protein T01_13952 [Trichinella spiralis]|uniref:Uncharacterized protein n=1 Tax=Trichinella spiralis TaxID=6334 RepID=A0A0V0Z3X1_TRISP|nr:hypothetical protein T01_13952 [Trichinella spiralis]